jgi:hypothetical protein
MLTTLPHSRILRPTMRLTRSSRWYAAVIALISILFMQLAVAAYACPQLAAGSANAQGRAMASARSHEMSCCAKPDPEQPALCHAHGQVGKQSLDKPEPPPVQPFSAVGLAIPLVHAAPVEGRTSAPAGIALLARATAPPLSIRNCCLRI